VKAIKKTYKKISGSCNHNPHVVATFSVIALLIGIITGGLFFSGFDIRGFATGKNTVAAEVLPIGVEMSGKDQICVIPIHETVAKAIAQGSVKAVDLCTGASTIYGPAAFVGASSKKPVTEQIYVGFVKGYYLFCKVPCEATVAPTCLKSMGFGEGNTYTTPVDRRYC